MSETRVRFVSPLERALQLKALDLLGELSRSELAAMAQVARERHFRKGAEIFPPGRRTGSFHVVTSGEVSVDGAEHGRETLGPRDTLGLLSMLAELPEGMEATAASETATLEIDGDDFNDVLEDHFNLVYMAIRGIARGMLRERMEIPEGAYLAPAEGRLACPDRELDLIERLLFLREGTALRNASMDSLIQIARNFGEIRYEKGDILWHPGDPSGSISLVVSGTASCTIEGNRRRFRVGPGYPLGNLESLAAEPRWYTPTAEGRLVVLSGRTDAFMDLLEDHFAMARGFLAAQAGGLIRLRRERRERDAAPDRSG